MPPYRISQWSARLDKQHKIKDILTMNRIYGQICRAQGNIQPLFMWHFFGLEAAKYKSQRILCMKGQDEHGTEHAAMIERGDRAVLVRWRDDGPGYICQVTRGHMPGETNKPVMV